MDTLPLNDVFGPTIQGEGPYMGRAVNFIRLGLCNLHCTQCDTKQTWDKDNYDLKKENPETSVDDIFERFQGLSSSNPRIVVISGGEPLMHQDKPAFRELLRKLVLHNYDVHIETNGTRKPRESISALVRHFSVSPKITSALISPQDELKKRIKIDVLATFVDLVRLERACFKVVCATPEDVDVAAELMSRLELMNEDVWIMPAGENWWEIEAHASEVLERALHYGFNFTPRLHILTGVK